MNWLQTAADTKRWYEVVKETKVPNVIHCEQNLKKKFGICTSCKQDVSNFKVVTFNYVVIGSDKKLAVHDIACDGT